MKSFFIALIVKSVNLIKTNFLGLLILRRYNFLAILLTTLIVLTVAACNSEIGQNQIVSRLSVETQIVNHALGAVKIPVKPQRVVVLHDMLLLDPVLALGVKPIGVTSCSACKEERFRGIPSNLVADIPEVGGISQPDIEKILALKPDLILGTNFQKNYYQLLSAIAPTVLIDYRKLYDFKERLQYIAQVLGKGDRAKEVITKYQQRIQELRQQLGEKLETKTISVIYLLGQGQAFSVYRSDYLAYGQIISDVGLRAIQENQKEIEQKLSIEVLPQYDADVLFIMTEFLTKDFIRANPEPLSFLRKPIWSQLKAVRNQQVYRVNWDVGGTLGANRVIDDLFKYLVKIP
ncbi:iron-siderophore ABC transporter substrate-binding protein [Anabaena subtropica]|uniref:Iron-siderophore ABC transporter substrate-binding protein n=1 Tax=Anabaena subtropica FACHB-260 TaxID=2692884 RepID=A0ABR8CRE9_9NOST|nr:iron-siderophore ABC transporter substrate-binding protein [Anabaena subtropica]MBD2345782.1 iron-siderophore ABC transporter substrate-binding protein [Anabaena subtropica FACHB-260]